MMGKRRNRRNNEVASSGGWEQIFCSLVLILVAFFAMLVSYSTIQGGRVTNFLQGFGSPSKEYSTGLSEDHVGRVNIYTGGGKTGGGQGVMRPSAPITESEAGQVSLYMEAMKKLMDEMNEKEAISVERTAGGFKLTLGSEILFPPGGAEFSRTAAPCLDRVASFAVEKDLSLRIEGHTDNRPISTRDFPSNWELSTARAVTVLRHLLKDGRLAADRLTAVGMSEYHPVASNDTPAGRRKNRRVEIHFYHRAETPAGKRE